jgi:hypothetical protein
MPKLRNRAVAGLAIVALLIAAAPAIGSEGTDPALIASYKWGWVTVRNTSLGTYTPAAVDRGSSAGRPVNVKQSQAGRYRVRFKGIGDDGGIPHVTAMGNVQRICVLTGWNRTSAGNQDVFVSCFTLAGVRVSTRFSLTYIATNGDPGPLAYLWTDGSATGDAASQYSFNSGGGTNHIDRSGPGVYVVNLGSIAADSGNPQVSVWNGGAFTAGVGPAGINPATCNVGFWSGGSSGVGIAVFCYDSHGTAVDSGFTLSYTDHQGLKGHATAKVAYLWANDPSSSSYTPDSFYSYSKPAGAAHINSSNIGRYTVTLARMPVGGAVVVTAYGSDAHTCQLSKIRTSTTPQKVQVRCFMFDGTPADSYFNLSYLR